MKDVLFVVKFSSNESETCAGVFDDFATAKAKVAELVESEADYAWVEVGGYPELRTKSQWAPKPSESLPEGSIWSDKVEFKPGLPESINTLVETSIVFEGPTEPKKSRKK